MLNSLKYSTRELVVDGNMKQQNNRKFKYNREYTYDIERLSSDNIDKLSTSMIPNGSRVLELGCSTGYLTSYITETKKCQVVGVDINKTALKYTKKWAQSVITADLNARDSWNKIGKLRKFDVVFASAVLEHLIDPWAALKNIKGLLVRNGILIVTVPNVAFWRNRLDLLKGDWKYQEYGILDITHNKFFTIKTIRQAIENSGFVIVEEKYDPGGGAKFFNPIIKLFPNLYAHQIALKAIKK